MCYPVARTRMPWFFLPLFVLVTSCLTGCGKSKVVATVNGTKIEKDDFYRQLERSHGANVLNWLIAQQLLRDEAAAQSVTVSPAELDKALADWKQSQGFVGDEAFFQMLKTRNWTVDDVKADLEFQLLVEKLRTKGVTVTDEEVKEFFEQNKDNLGTPALVTVGEVVCRTQEDAAQAKQKLDADAGMPEVVREFMSDDPVLQQLRERNGIWPPRRKEDIYPTDLQDLCFELPVGEVSDPVKSSLGFWHVIRIIERSAAKAPVFEEVKESLARQLVSQKGKPEQVLMNELAQKANVRIQWPEYLALQDQFGRPSVVPGTLPPAPPAVGKGPAKAGGGGQPAPGIAPASPGGAKAAEEPAGKSGE